MKTLPSIRLSIIILVGIAIYLVFAGAMLWREFNPSPATLAAFKANALRDLDNRGLKPGMPVFIRIFKKESRLELWMKDAHGWQLFRNFPICRWSGKLGPKFREGDRQSPEGFYRVTLSSLNPNSRNHLAFNLGFPNRYDRSYNRTGSFLMVHGGCTSIGCYAITNEGIEVVYHLVEAALRKGQRHVPVHIFPFRMTPANMQRYAKSRWMPFWKTLKPAADLFDKTGRLPLITVSARRYVVKTN